MTKQNEPIFKTNRNEPIFNGVYSRDNSSKVKDL